MAFGVASAWDAEALRAAWSTSAPRDADAALAADAHADADGPHVVCVDVGGLSSAQGELDTLSLLSLLSGCWGSVRAIVIKSHCMCATARTLTAADTRAHQPRERAGAGEALAGGAVRESSARRREQTTLTLTLT